MLGYTSPTNPTAITPKSTLLWCHEKRHKNIHLREICKPQFQIQFVLLINWTKMLTYWIKTCDKCIQLKRELNCVDRIALLQLQRRLEYYPIQSVRGHSNCQKTNVSDASYRTLYFQWPSVHRWVLSFGLSRNLLMKLCKIRSGAQQNRPMVTWFCLLQVLCRQK